MCGIFAQISRPLSSSPPDLNQPGCLLQEAAERLSARELAARELSARELSSRQEMLDDIAGLLVQADQLLSGLAGFMALANSTQQAAQLLEKVAEIEAGVESVLAGADAVLSGADAVLSEAELNTTQLQDVLWSLRHDRLQAANEALDLIDAHNTRTEPADTTELTEFQLGAARVIQTALSALDRLEVRGRDSAGISIILPALPLDSLPASLVERQADSQLLNRSVRLVKTTAGPASGTDPASNPDSASNPDPASVTNHASATGPAATVCFTYKTAATIGELGDNSKVLRQAITTDLDLRDCLANLHSHAAVLAHTRWASVGEITQANAHPLDSLQHHKAPQHNELQEQTFEPLVIAAVNGDIDNHQELVDRHQLALPEGITTDSKVAPLLVADAIQNQTGTALGFATAVKQFEGSAAVVACSLEDPGKLLLSVHGSGQALYVGLAQDSFVVASEPYGILEQTNQYIRLGGTASATAAATGRSSEAAILHAQDAGEIQGVQKLAVGTESLSNGQLAESEAVSESDVITAEMTTRDVTRGDYPHYLLKEISQSPMSVQKTLKSRLSHQQELDDLLQAGRISRIIAIGQGTAAIAAKAFAEICTAELNDLRALADSPALNLLEVKAMAASELSGFSMKADMSDHVIVAISQSGTTTDTNRTVDLLRARGAAVVAIVNRRNTDLAHKADHVMHTSDGRDVEMSVASTKAFYSQVTASSLLAFQIADSLADGILGNSGGASESGGTREPDGANQSSPAVWQKRRKQKLATLKSLPDALASLLKQHTELRQIARAVTTQHRDLAVVGSGRDKIAAQEVRIKLSELCYKSVSFDSIEDKKHIDLSSEPLTVVCAAGIGGSNIDDIAKEVAIYCAHEACPVVLVADDVKFSAPPGAHVVRLPVAAPELGFVSSAMAGHLFAYEAALAVDGLADPLRQTQQIIEQLLAELPSLPEPASQDSTAKVLEQIAQRWEDSHEAVATQAKTYAKALAKNQYDGYLGAGLAAEISSLYKYSGGLTNLASYQREFGSVGTPEAVWRRFLAALTEAIAALTRPIDAIRHQAKTVTVGITRTDAAMASSPLVTATLSAGATTESLSYETLRELSALALTVREITGHTRYLLLGDKLNIASRSGISESIKSQVDTDPDLRGIKFRVAGEQRVFLTTGRRDTRTIILVPEVLDSQTVAITLLHVELRDFLAADEAVAALKGYKDRYEALWGAVTETEKSFDTSRLEQISVRDLFMEPIVTLSERWRQ